MDHVPEEKTPVYGFEDVSDSRHTLGLAGCLLESILTSITALARLSLQQGHDDSSLTYSKTLHRKSEQLLLWGDGHTAFDGSLDDLLSKSTQLRHAIFASLYGLGSAIETEWSRVEVWQSTNNKGNNINQSSLKELRMLLEQAAFILDRSSDLNKNYLSDDDCSLTGIDDFFDDVSGYIDCLTDLSFALDNPILDPEPFDSFNRTSESFEVASPLAIPYCHRIRDRFDKLEKWLVERLGEANAHRADSLRVLRDMNQQARTAQLDVETHTPSEPPPSTKFFDSGLGLLSTQSGRTSERPLHALTRPSPDIPDFSVDASSLATSKSFTTIASTLTLGRPRVPLLPKEAQTGVTFSCTVCRRQLPCRLARDVWRKHVYSDLSPYICTFRLCKTAAKIYTSRRDWENHERSHHPSIWNESECPFCEKSGLSTDRVGYYRHIAKHLREISLAAIPQGANDSDDGGSQGSSDDDESLGFRSAKPIAAVEEADPKDLGSRILVESPTNDPFLQNTITELFDINHVQEKYPKLYKKNRWLSKRLGSANSKRRQFIKYRREHKARLHAHDDEKPIVHDGSYNELSSKATTLVHNIEPSVLEATSGDEDDAISVMTATTTFNSETKLKLPSLGELAPDGAHFECPICFTLISIKNEKAWKIHAFRDLKAYVCTVGEAECNSLFFGDRNSWFQHELQNHRSCYNCTLCDQEFRSKSVVMEHISSAHGPFPEDQLSPLAEAYCVTPSQFRAKDCPFCDDWAVIMEQNRNPKGKGVGSIITHDNFVSVAKFKKHIATHQEQLAIFVVTRSNYPDADENFENNSFATISQANSQDIQELSTNSAESIQKVETNIEVETIEREPKSSSIDVTKENQRNIHGLFRMQDVHHSGSPSDGNHNDITDENLEINVLYIRIDNTKYLISFHAESQGKGKLRVIDLRDAIADAMNISGTRKKLIRMSYRGRDLDEMEQPLQKYVIYNNSEIQVKLPAVTDLGRGKAVVHPPKIPAASMDSGASYHIDGSRVGPVWNYNGKRGYDLNAPSPNYSRGGFRKK